MSPRTAQVTWDDYFAKGSLTDHVARWQELRNRGLSACAIATLKARGDYDPARHGDAADYPPLSAEDYLELLALGEAIARHVRHPSDIHQAVTAGATWAQVSYAVGRSEEDLRQSYRTWAEGQHNLYLTYDGKLGMSDAEYALALACAGGERR
jgi:hypothetical protein